MWPIFYVKCKCVNGHVWANIDNFGDELPLCPICEFDAETIDMEAFKIQDAVYETCNLNHRHCISDVLYREPTEQELFGYKE